MTDPKAHLEQLLAEGKIAQADYDCLEKGLRETKAEQPHRRGSHLLARGAACVPGLVLWAVAAMLALRWLTLLGAGQITFGDSGSAFLLPLLWTGVMGGFALAIQLAVKTTWGRVPIIWQTAVALCGLVAMVMCVGD